MNGINVFRHLLLTSGLRPCTITLVSNFGGRGGFSPALSSGNNGMYRRLGSTLPIKSHKTPWKPLSDPAANRATLRRVSLVIAAVGCIFLTHVWVLYSTSFQYPPEPARVSEMRQRPKY